MGCPRPGWDARRGKTSFVGSLDQQSLQVFFISALGVHKLLHRVYPPTLLSFIIAVTGTTIVPDSASITTTSPAIISSNTIVI